MNEETEITTTFIDTDPTYNDELQEIISQLDTIKSCIKRKRYINIIRRLSENRQRIYAVYNCFCGFHRRRCRNGLWASDISFF